MNFSSDDLAGMFNNVNFSDIELLSNDDHKFYACKKVLKSSCPYFALGNKLKNKDELKLDISGKILGEILKWIYLKDVHIEGFNKREFKEFINVAEKFGLRSLIRRCSESTESNQTDFSNDENFDYDNDSGQWTADSEKEQESLVKRTYSKSQDLLRVKREQKSQPKSEFNRSLSADQFVPSLLMGALNLKEDPSNKTPEKEAETEPESCLSSSFFSEKSLRRQSRSVSESFWDTASDYYEAHFTDTDKARSRTPLFQNRLYLSNIERICNGNNLRQNCFYLLMEFTESLQVEKSKSTFFSIRLKEPIIVDVISWRTTLSHVTTVRVVTYDEKWSESLDTHGAHFVQLDKPTRIIEIFFRFSGQVLKINSLEAGLKILIENEDLR